MQTTMTRTRQDPDQATYAEVGGQRVRYRIRGDGPPLLMINGLGAPLEFWRPLESKLAEFQTITVDPPGAGRSSVPSAPFGMDGFADVMNSLLDHLEVERASVLGLSFGGQVAQELAHRHPDRVEKLVLVSTLSSRAINPRATAILARSARARIQTLRAMAAGQEMVRGGGEPILRLQRDLLGSGTTGRGVWLQLRAATGWSSRSWLDELRMPVLVIAGGEDPLVPLSQGRRIAAAVPDGRLEAIPDGGHLWILKHPEPASRLIRDFLRSEPR